MGKVIFNLTPVADKPLRHYRKGSKYDPILDAFLEGEARLVEVSLAGKEANYLRIRLNKRIKDRKLRVRVSVVNNKCYLEK